MQIELTDMPPIPVPSIVHANDARAVEIIRDVGQKFLDTSPEHRMSAQQDVLRGSRLEYEETLGYALAKGRELDVPTLDTLSDILWLPMRARCLIAVLTSRSQLQPRQAAPLFPTTSRNTRRRVPGAPWKEEIYTQSGAIIRVDREHAFSGRKAMTARHRAAQQASRLHGHPPGWAAAATADSDVRPGAHVAGRSPAPRPAGRGPARPIRYASSIEI